MANASLPLDHIRVLDLSRVLAGPWAGQVLADLGAEVIKIERPGAGDDTRSWGPPYAVDQNGQPSDQTAYFLSANRGKRSLSVDIASSQGQEIIRRLAAQCDVVIENFKVGGLAKYGLDYDALRAVNPQLIYCSITGFGQDGPYRHRPGYDFMIQGMAGLMSITGIADEDSGEPVKVGVAVADVFTGLYAAIAILGALVKRDKTSDGDYDGDYIDLALLDTQVAVLANQALNYLTSGIAPQRLGNAHPNIVPYQAFASADGHLILAVGNDQQFTRFCDLAGRAELAQEPRFASNPDRVKNRTALIPIIQEIMKSRTTAAWLDALGEADVPCGPINDLADVFDDEQIKARGLRLDLAHPTLGSVPSVANPIRYRSGAATSALAPPLLGQHTAEILRELLGYDEAQIDSLREQGIIQTGSGL